MKNVEFQKRFGKTYVPNLDSDMIPVLIAEEGVFSPGDEEECIEFNSKDSAIAYWVDKGYKVFVLIESMKQ
jgi:hypothetical protein